MRVDPDDFHGLIRCVLPNDVRLVLGRVLPGIRFRCERSGQRGSDFLDLRIFHGFTNSERGGRTLTGEVSHEIFLLLNSENLRPFERQA